MFRTQVYLTEVQRKELAAIAGLSGKHQSELIREAIDRFIDQARGRRLETVLNRTAGMWKDRKDLPDFRSLRNGWDRS